MNVDLFDEVQRSRIECVSRHTFIRQQIRRYHGLGFLGTQGTPEPENVGYQFATHTVARLSSMRPRVTFGTRREVAEDRVEGLEAFHRRWARDTAWQRERERIILDMCFGSGIAYVSQRPSPGFEQFADPVHVPMAVRLSPALYGVDIDATSTDDARFKFHRTIVARADFLKQAENEAGWDLDLCKSLVEQSAAAARNQPDDKSNRKAIVYETIWCPNETLPEDAEGWMDMTPAERSRCHGVIYTYAMDYAGSGVELRMPMPYFGPRGGPYVDVGFMYVPDEVGFLGPLTANDGQIQQLNAQARANDLSSQRKKDIAVMNGNTPDGNSAVLAAKDGDVLVLPGFDAATVASLSVGGISADSRAREMELRSRVDRGIGLAESGRGEVTGVGTATENQIAAEATSNINNLWKRKVRDLDEGVALRVCWFADQDERTFIKTGPGEFVLGGNTPTMQLDALRRAYANKAVDLDTFDQASEILGQMIEQDDPEEGGSFEDLEIEVEVLGDDATEAVRMQQVDALIMNAPMIPQIALFTDLKEYMQAKADMLGLPWVAKMYDIDAAKAVGAAMMQAEAPEPEAKKPPSKLKSSTPAGAGVRAGQPRAETQATNLRVKSSGSKQKPTSPGGSN